MKRFDSTKAGANDPIRIDQVFAEKPNGGIVTEPGFDAPASTAVYETTGGKFAVIKGYRLVAAVEDSDTTIKIAKGSGIVSGDVIGYGSKGVASTAVDKTTSAEYDTVTVTMGVDIPNGSVLYQANAASANAAVPKGGTPVYVIGNDLKAGLGDQPVRLINGANLRKSTANIGVDIAAKMKNINLV